MAQPIDNSTADAITLLPVNLFGRRNFDSKRASHHRDGSQCVEAREAGAPRHLGATSSPNP